MAGSCLPPWHDNYIGDEKATKCLGITAITRPLIATSR
jgi:hypothetical protein